MANEKPTSSRKLPFWAQVTLFLLILGAIYAQRRWFPVSDSTEPGKTEITQVVPDSSSTTSTEETNRSSSSSNTTPSNSSPTDKNNPDRPPSSTQPRNEPAAENRTSNPTLPAEGSGSRPQSNKPQQPAGTASPNATGSTTASGSTKTNPAPSTGSTRPANPSGGASSTTKPRTGIYVEKDIAHNVQLLDLNGDVVYHGDIDLTDTLDRIEQGDLLSQFPNDGSVFGNRERRLPNKINGYYREWVHPTSGLSGPGPQRIITGKGGEIFYTPDHYKRFYPVRRE